MAEDCCACACAKSEGGNGFETWSSNMGESWLLWNEAYLSRVCRLSFLESTVCGVENLPPLHGRSVMAGVDFYRVFPSRKWRYTREPIWPAQPGFEAQATKRALKKKTLNPQTLNPKP